MITVSSVSLPLYSDYYYSYVVNLEGNSYTLDFKYNDRGSKWFLSLLDSDGNPIVQGVALVPNYPITEDYVIPNLSGFFWLSPIPTVNTEKPKEFPRDIAQYYVFEYVYNFAE